MSEEKKQRNKQTAYQSIKNERTLLAMEVGKTEYIGNYMYLRVFNGWIFIDKEGGNVFIPENCPLKQNHEN